MNDRGADPPAPLRPVTAQKDEDICHTPSRKGLRDNRLVIVAPVKVPRAMNSRA
jgi:hypothetical protein